MERMPTIDLDKCNGCGLCVTVCHCGAFVMVEEVVTIVETELCAWCTNCEMVCPTGAIRCPFEIVMGES